MKKNVMMRIASVLLIAVLISTCGISGTYAKYVTSDTSTDSARVAKWGVTVVGSDAMFSTSYDTHDTPMITHIGATSVVNGGGDSKDLLAPGTNGKLADFAIYGTPEVAVRVKYEITNLELTGWALSGGETYCPIIFTVNGTDYYIGATETVDAFATRVKNAVAAYTRVYAAGVTLEGQAAAELQLSWRWNFEGGSWTYQTDDKDTYLGNQATIPGNAAAINITVACTVEQVD